MLFQAATKKSECRYIAAPRSCGPPKFLVQQHDLFSDVLDSFSDSFAAGVLQCCNFILGHVIPITVDQDFSRFGIQFIHEFEQQVLANNDVIELGTDWAAKYFVVSMFELIAIGCVAKMVETQVCHRSV